MADAVWKDHDGTGTGWATAFFCFLAGALGEVEGKATAFIVACDAPLTIGGW
ncbi:MAG TPA: hypothetical protein VGJ66_09070 [Pyrinomonadaceae bacterium]